MFVQVVAIASLLSASLRDDPSEYRFEITDPEDAHARTLALIKHMKKSRGPAFAADVYLLRAWIEALSLYCLEDSLFALMDAFFTGPGRKDLPGTWTRIVLRKVPMWSIRSWAERRDARERGSQLGLNSERFGIGAEWGHFTGGHPLPDDLKKEARIALGDSVDLDRVLIFKERIPALGIAWRRPVFRNGKMFFVISVHPKAFNDDGTMSLMGLSAFIHEMAHIRQFMPRWKNPEQGKDEYLRAVMGSYSGKDTDYDWRAAIERGLAFDQLNVEQQANLIQAHWSAIRMLDPDFGPGPGKGMPDWFYKKFKDDLALLGPYSKYWMKPGPLTFKMAPPGTTFREFRKGLHDLPPTAEEERVQSGR